jgi:hypothetical protein
MAASICCDVVACFAAGNNDKTIKVLSLPSMSQSCVIRHAVRICLSLLSCGMPDL